MNRREFLKNAAAAVAIVIVPEIASNAAADSSVRFGSIDNFRFIETPDETWNVYNDWNSFDPAKRYAHGFQIMAHWGEETGKELVAKLHADMAKHIPPWYRRRVEIHGPTSHDYGHYYGHSIKISWRYRPPGDNEHHHKPQLSVCARILEKSV